MLPTSSESAVTATNLGKRHRLGESMRRHGARLDRRHVRPVYAAAQTLREPLLVH